jgi:hypothetical protein
MSDLVAEILLRLAKAALVALLAAGLYLLLTGPLGEPGSAVLALLCWLSVAAFWLLAETSPL